MSTNITIDVLLQRLKQVSDQTTEQNRAERLEREDALQQEQRDTTTTSRSQSLLALQSTRQGQSALEDSRTRSAAEHSGVPDLYKKRRPAAQRDGDLLVPFAITWRGELESRAPTTFEILLTENDGTAAIRPSVFTYRGGDYLEPQSFQIAAGGSKVSVAQQPRYSEWNTEGQISLNNLTVGNWKLEGFWAEELINITYLDWPSSWPLVASPGNLSPVGVLTHNCTPLYLSVATDGSIFLVVKLPPEIVDTQSAVLPDSSFVFPPGIGRSDVRPIWWGDPAYTSPMFLAGLQQYVSLGGSKWYSSYSISTSTSAASRPLHTFAFKEPYMFLRSKGGKTDSKIEYFNQYSYMNPYDLDTNFNQFIASKSYADDPGRNMRDIYTGEVRIKGNQAHKLRMRYEEVFEGDTYIWYEDFPYLSLTGFITGTGAQARLEEGVTFEDHIYNLSPYSTDAQLADQLAAIRNPTSYQDQPEYLPDKVVKLKLSPSFIAQAAKQISTSGADVLTPLTYFVAMP